MRFHLLPGNRYDTVGVEPLIKNIDFDALLADKAFDANRIIEEMNERAAQIVISQRPQRRKPLKIDEDMYKWRHLVENLFAKLKEFKDIAMRSAKTDRNFTAMIHAATAVIHLGAQPACFIILVLVEVSSMNVRRSRQCLMKGRRRLIQIWRGSRTSGRFCSCANSVFFHMYNPGA